MPITVICPGSSPSPRFSRILQAALGNTEAVLLPDLSIPVRNGRILFAISLDEAGQNDGLYRLLG